MARIRYTYVSFLYPNMYLQLSLLRHPYLDLCLFFGRRLIFSLAELFRKGVRSYLCHVTKVNTVWKKTPFVNVSAK